jgi:uncharacterized membrane protein YphA (DoxX/SURF4 family)
MSAKARIYLYFTTLGLFALAMTASGVMDVLHPKELVETLGKLGYPAYVLILLGVWKLLGVVAIVAPGVPRLKEWAYAGFAFDLSGAFVSHLASGDGLGKASIPLVLLSIGLASWSLRPSTRRLAATT